MTDVVVIGGGVIGSSIAYHLARAGANVKLLEKGTIANPGGASRASAGGVRENDRDPRELPLAKASIDRWEYLEKELDADLEFRSSGQLMLYHHSYSPLLLQEKLALNEKSGISSNIVNQRQLQDMIPLLSQEFTQGIFYPRGGHANPLLTTLAFASAARKLGAQMIKGMEVHLIKTDKQRVVGVETSDGFILCETVINAAGAWAPQLYQTLGLSVPIYTWCPQMSATLPAPPLLGTGPTISVYGRILSLKQTTDGRLRAGGGYPSGPGPNEYSGLFSEESLVKQRKEVLSVIPAAADYPVDYTYYGAEAKCVDEVPILGPIPEVKGYLLTAGFSGHGFTLSPGVGQVLAEMAQGKKPTISIEGLLAERIYERSTLVAEQVRSHPG